MLVHTEGPYTIDLYADSEWEYHSRITAPDGRVLANVTNQGFESDGNAQLFAVAPKMLEALRDALNYIDPTDGLEAQKMRYRIEDTILMATGMIGVS